MPFMSRVGAMPPPSRTDGQTSAQQQQQQQGGRVRSNRQKGITMEDLKKQTALRLAQEQHHGPAAVPGSSRTAAVASDPRTRHPVVTPQTLAARRILTTATTTAPPLNREATMPVHYQRLHHQSPLSQHTPNTVEAPRMNGSYYFDNTAPNSRSKNPRQAKFVEMSLAENQHQAPSATTSNVNARYHPDQRSQYVGSASTPVLPANPTSLQSAVYNSEISLQAAAFNSEMALQEAAFNSASSTLDAPSNAGGQPSLQAAVFNSASSTLGVAASSSGGQSSSSSKLPHGLTVYELKEMTKARLQAEAADKMSSSSVNSDRPPSATTTEMEAREASSSGLDLNSNYGQSGQVHVDTNGLGNDPRMIPAQVGFDQESGLRPAQVSPIPTLHGFGHQSTSSSSFHDAMAQDPNRSVGGNRNRVDSFPDSNWENASVTSHNSTVASEYMGSESAFSSGVNGYGQLDDPSGMPLGRTQSYPVGNGSRENTPISISPMGAPYYEPSASMSQSRQRAMTLSPRPGLSLLHEDRPGFSEDELGIPSFSSSRHGHARQQLTARSRRSFSPIMQQPQPFAGNGLEGFGDGSLHGIVGPNVIENRPRTSSAVSLPAISHTADEFALDVNGPGSSRRSSDSVNTREPPIREHFAVSGTGSDGFLGSSSFYSGLEGRSQSVFRNEYGGIPAPPGLGHENLSLSGSATTNPLASRAGSLDSLGSNNRARASTWAPAATSDVFGSSSGLYDYSGDDTLAGDLASILKLSGAEEKPDFDRPGMFNDTAGSFLGGNPRGF